MKIQIAKSAGFCFGVNRAVEMVYSLLREGKQVYTLGPIIHNPRWSGSWGSRGYRLSRSRKRFRQAALWSYALTAFLRISWTVSRN